MHSELEVFILAGSSVIIMDCCYSNLPNKDLGLVVFDVDTQGN